MDPFNSLRIDNLLTRGAISHPFLFAPPILGGLLINRTTRVFTGRDRSPFPTIRVTPTSEEVSLTR
jgi:hypothetical protein